MGCLIAAAIAAGLIAAAVFTVSAFLIIHETFAAKPRIKRR